MKIADINSLETYITPGAVTVWKEGWCAIATTKFLLINNPCRLLLF